MPLIVANAISKTYPSGEGRLNALDGVSFTIDDGDFVAIMGASGSGKTTLMNLIGLLDQPSSGTLRFGDKDVTGLSPNQQALIRNRQIGFVFQSYNLLSRSTSIENVELPLVYSGIPKKERRYRAKKLLDEFGLGDRIHHWPTKLSGGEQQRVAIARAMVGDPALILADEPTGALDSETGSSVLSLFQKLNDMGKAIILVTHDPAVARHAARILHLKDGRLVEEERVVNRQEALEEDEPALDLPKQTAVEAPPLDQPDLERTQEMSVGGPSKDPLDRTRASRRIPLGRATARGLTEELARMEEAVKASAEEATKVHQQLCIARAQSRALSKYFKILAIVFILLMICMIAQIFMVENLLRR